MNELLKIATDAHGGLERWHHLRTVSADLSIGGALWDLKGRSGDRRAPRICKKERAVMTDTATIEDAKAIVKSFYEGGARGEITSFADRLAENFELFVPPSLPWGGHFDKAQYLSILPRVASTLDFARMRYISLTAEGQHVVALIDIGVQGTDKSVIISEHWDIEDGKAIRLLVAYFDPQILLDQIKSNPN